MTTQAMAQAMLASAKMALRITTTSFDTEIEQLLTAALMDLGTAGVIPPDGQTVDELIRRACITYVRMYFGQPDDFDRMKAAYDEQKGQLQIATGYTEWSTTSNG